MRLIDADKLPLDIEHEDVDDAPTIDAVEVVRCKNCKWYREGYDINGEWFSLCKGNTRPYRHTEPDWFCADGEVATVKDEDG